MPPQVQRRVTLSAGEECTIVGNGLVQATLLSGAVDVAGAFLSLNRPSTFYLFPSCRSIVLYTLEGGSVSLASDTAVTVHKNATGAAAIVQLTRRTLLPLARARVLVIGDYRGGKTLAAHTLVNLLRRYGAETDDGSSPCRVCLLDLNSESDALYSPGCFAALELPLASSSSSSVASTTGGAMAPLWLGNTASPRQVVLPFYVGSAARPSLTNVNTFLHFCEQLHDTTTAMLQDSVTVAGQREYVVVDAPAPVDGLTEGVLYKKLIELLRPSHVVVVGDRAQRERDSDWCAFLQEDVQRVLPDCEFVLVGGLSSSRPCPQPPRDLLLREYFVGVPSTPLGCSKVVVSVQSLQFVSYGDDSGAAAATGLSVQHVTPGRGWQNLVCALSHAETLEEVPLAPIAGLTVVSAVDEENDEVVLIIPAAQQEPLQRRFVIVPNASGQASMRLTDSQMATVEESVVS